MVFVLRLMVYETCCHLLAIIGNVETWYVQFPPEEFASANDSLPLRIPTIHDISFATIVHSLAAIHAASGFTHASTVKSPIESNVLLSVALKY